MTTSGGQASSLRPPSPGSDALPGDWGCILVPSLDIQRQKSTTAGV